MSDDLRIQQRPSAMPYILGGGAVGAGLGYWGLDKIDATRKLVSDPGKYASFEELAKEASDKDAFVKTIDAAEGETKTLLEKMKDFDEKKIIQEAEEKWQNEFNEFKAGKQVGLPEGHELLNEKANLDKAKEAAQKALDDKIAALEKAEAEKLAKAGASGQPNTEAVKNITRKINQAQAESAKAQTKLNNLVDDYARKMAEVRGEEVNTLREKTRTLIEKEGSTLSERAKNSSAEVSALREKANTLRKNASTIKTEAENAIRNEINSINGLSNKQKEKLIKDALDDFSSRIQVFEASQAELPGLKKAEQELIQALDKRLKGKLNGKAIPMERKISYIESKLPQNESRLQELEQKFAQHIQDVKAQKRAVAEHNASRISEVKETVIENGKKVQRTIQRELSPERTFVPQEFPEMKELQQLRTSVKADKELLDTAKKVKTQRNNLDAITARKVELVVPESNRLKGLKNSLAQQASGNTGVADDVAAKAKEIVAKDPSKFAAESNALKEATTKVDDVAKKIAEEAGKLGNNVDEKSLIEEFAKSGKGTKEEAGKKAVQSFKDEVKALFEGKINNKKLAAGVAIAAVAVAGLALLFRPKAKEQA